MCLVGEKLGLCETDVEPDIVVRAPYYIPTASKPPRFVLEYGRRDRVALTCRPVDAPCWPCDTADDCFTGGACVDGRCRTTALCQ